MNVSLICFIPPFSPMYWEAVALRYEVLRRPLGLDYSPSQLWSEGNDLHLVFVTEKRISGYLLLSEVEEKKIKMRQVVVKEEQQGKGIGRKMIAFTEQFVKEKGYTHMYCHARESAVSFYEKMGWSKKGERFTEVGIPHFYMEKETV